MFYFSNISGPVVLMQFCVFLWGEAKAVNSPLVWDINSHLLLMTSFQVTDMMVANSSNLIVTVKPANQRTLMPRRGSFSRWESLLKLIKWCRHPSIKHSTFDSSTELGQVTVPPPCYRGVLQVWPLIQFSLCAFWLKIIGFALQVNGKSMAPHRGRE